jgi:hypothetical protein
LAFLLDRPEAGLLYLMSTLLPLMAIGARSSERVPAAHHVVATVLRLFRARRALLYRVDRGTQDLVCVAATGDRDPHDWIGERLPIGAGVAGHAVSTGRPLWLPDVLATGSNALPDWAVHRIRIDGFRSVAAVPMLIEGEPAGALSVSDSLGRVFTDHDLEMLTAFADQAALALDKAERVTQLEALADVGRLLSQTLDPNEVGRQIAHSVLSLLDVQIAFLFRLDLPSGSLTTLAAASRGAVPLRHDAVLPRGTGLAALAIAERRPAVTADILGDPRVDLDPPSRTRIERDGYCSALAVPLLGEGRVLGVLTVRDRTGRRFRDDEVRLAQAFADQAAIAIQNAHVFTREREARAALQASEAGFRLLFEHNPLPMWVYDLASLRFLEVNAAAVDHYGYSRAEFLAMRITDIRPAEEVDRLLEMVARVRSDPIPRRYSGQWRHRRKDGQMIDVEIVSDRIDFTGRSAHLVVAQDVTARRALEDQLRQAQKMEAVGQLAGGIAHDFNNLLTVITGRSQLLLARRLAPNAEARHDVELIQHAAARAATLTGQLLAFSRKQVVQPRLLDLNAVIRNVESMLRRLIGEQITLRAVLAPDLWRTTADPGQIEQVLINLVVNARDAMPDGGWVTVETANVDLDESYARRHVGAQPGPHVALIVSDSGIGMEPATLERVFEPFFTTKAPGKGTGLGLSTVYGIVRQSGGTVWVDSEPGRGTTFKIHLPRARDDVVVSEAPPHETAPMRGAETILLLEDDPGVADLAQEILAAQGYRVLAARLPSEALRLAGGHAGPIHLLVTDVIMPEASGRQCAEQLQAQRPSMKVLYVSGYTDDAIARHGVLDPGVAFLAKPFSPDALARKVRAVLDSR